jgi:cell volume regulation protein A
MIAMPRGIAAGVLSMLPMTRGIPQMENLSAGVFSTIVFSVLLFALGFALFGQNSLNERTSKNA